MEDRKSSRFGKLLGGKKSKFGPKMSMLTRSQLQQLYDLTPYEANKLRKLFNEFSGIDRKLNFQEFVCLFGYWNDFLRGPHIIGFAEKAFHAADTNDDGLISFDEFLVAYCLTKPCRTFEGHPDIYCNGPLAPSPLLPPPPQLVGALPIPCPDLPDFEGCPPSNNYQVIYTGPDASQPIYYRRLPKKCTTQIEDYCTY